VDNTTIFNT